MRKLGAFLKTGFDFGVKSRPWISRKSCATVSEKNDFVRERSGKKSTRSGAKVFQLKVSGARSYETFFQGVMYIDIRNILRASGSEIFSAAARAPLEKFLAALADRFR